MARVIALLAVLLATAAAIAAPELRSGGLNEFEVELPTDLRKIAGRGELSPVARARVTIALPANFDAARDWPVLVVSATSDRGYQSSRRLLGIYASAALPQGWIAVAADPAEDVSGDEDNVPLRYALNVAALAALRLQWPGVDKAPLAFAGFSGGSKYSGWLAATFASRGRRIIGIYVAGINEDTVLDAARELNVLNESYKNVPVFLQSGETDEISTPADHQRIRDELRRAGFRHLRIEYFPGPHVVDPGPLGVGLAWFRELGGLTAAPN
jgi:predicted esterase